MTNKNTNNIDIASKIRSKDLLRITDKEIEALIKFCYTEQCKSFSLGYGLSLSEINDKSAKWRFRYTFGGKRHDTNFGKYPSVSLKAARDKAIKYNEQINMDVNPIMEKKVLIEEKKKEQEIEAKHLKNTVGFIAQHYFEIKQNNKHLKDITIEKSERRLYEHFFKHLRNKENTLISDITLDNIVNILHKLELSNKLETLTRTKMLIVGLYEFAYSNDIINDSNIFTKLKLRSFKLVHKSNVKNNPTLLEDSDIKKLYQGMLEYKYGVHTKFALLLSIHTAQRQGSIISAKWSDINLEDATWSIPASEMKMKKAHIVPLSDVLMGYLKELYKVSSHHNDYLFPNAQHLNRHMSNNTVNHAIRRLGFTKEQQTAHGLRAMFKTIAKSNQNKHNLSNEYVERVLAHKVGTDVENVYLRVMPIEEMRKILNWWSDYLESLLDPQ